MLSSECKIDKKDVSEVKIERFNYQWKIKNFSHLHMQPGEKVESPTFTFGSSESEIKWFIRLYPNGKSKEITDGINYLGISLCWNSSSIINGVFRLSLINDEKEKEVSGKGELRKKMTSNEGLCFEKFIKRDFILNTSNGLLPNDCLTINCEVVLSSDDVRLTKEKEHKRESKIKQPEPNLLGKLFLQEDLSDVKLIALGGECLPAHRSVLAASSPVFQAMFKNDMLEQRLGEVKIDEADYETLKEMLRFIYFGKVENLESVTFELLKVAHRYELVGLTELCGEELIKQIRIENVLKFITIADIYGMEDFKAALTNFAKANFKGVVNSNEFESSMDIDAIKSLFKVIGQL